MSEVDRISDLPDPLLLHILSFLSTTQVVRTCVLSKRWSNLWVYVPSLTFDSIEFDSASLNELEDVLKFQLLVNSVLLDRGVSKLDRMYIRSWYDHSHNTAAARTWVCHAVRCNPRAFTMVYSGSSKLNMPQSIFTCASLEVLCFWAETGSDEDREVVMPKLINLPRLEYLGLGRVAVGENCIHTFFSACPFLEELEMEDCIGFSDISSQKLKSLIIDDCNVEKMLCISTPNLEYLEIKFTKETVVGGILLQEMRSLYEAKFHFDSEIDIADIPREFVLLSKISNVTCLRLEGSGVVVKAILEKEVPNCSIFHNLRCLYVDGLCISNDFDLVASFFCLLPNLENLVLKNEGNSKKSAMGKARGDLPWGTLKSKCLKTVEIQYPKGSNVHELERVLLASIEDPERVRIILSSY